MPRVDLELLFLGAISIISLLLICPFFELKRKLDGRFVYLNCSTCGYSKYITVEEHLYMYQISPDQNTEENEKKEGPACV